MDDCEICDPLKTKNVIHKLNCVYFTIDNMPQKFLAKTDNLFLVSLCETKNLKIGDNTFDEIGELIVNEMKQLENIGIQIGNQVIKGGLARIVSDNLGANDVLGYTESFRSHSLSDSGSVSANGLPFDWLFGREKRTNTLTFN